MEEEDPSEMLHRLVLEDGPPAERLTDCFRMLRNTCAASPETQSKIGQRDSVLIDANTAIGLVLNSGDSEDWKLCLRVSAQFLGNLIVNNSKNQMIVWARCSSQLKRMAQNGDPKLTNICLMVLYNILLGNPNISKELVKDAGFIDIICSSGAEGQEFAQYIIEHLLTKEIDWSSIYNSNISVQGRLFQLDVIESKVKQSAESVPVTLVTYLASQFRQQSDCILRTVADRVDSLEPDVVAVLLRVLASCSPLPPHLQALQADKSFIINCAFLLKSIHEAGKAQQNCFSTVPKLSAADDLMQSHPAFGFKASLVQVLGNLSHKHKGNQDLMRELDIIPLLLDCCNIDARNPFIIQWVVLAVRNLCDGNLANQAVIANMSRQGLVETSVLSELGLTLHADDDNNQIRIAPINLSSGNR